MYYQRTARTEKRTQILKITRNPHRWITSTILFKCQQYYCHNEVKIIEKNPFVKSTVHKGKTYGIIGDPHIIIHLAALPDAIQTGLRCCVGKTRVIFGSASASKTWLQKAFRVAKNVFS